MPGYSGTPLPKKLGIKDGFRVCFVGEPAEVRAGLKTSLAGCTTASDGKDPLDFAMVFTLKDGKVIRFREFTDSAAINAAFA